MKNVLQNIISDCGKGESQALMGLIDYLLERGVSLSRIISIAEIHFKIPKHVALETLEYFT